MVEKEDYLRALARRAHQEAPHTGRVTGRVLAQLRAEADASATPRPLLAFACTSMAVSLALMVGIVLMQHGQSADPLMAYFDAGLSLNTWGSS